MHGITTPESSSSSKSGVKLCPECFSDVGPGKEHYCVKSTGKVLLLKWFNVTVDQYFS